ncbi:hypothetical protein PPROV_000569100 [Pycnococcus provasolii]|uniref:Uncharacterized protein n=1 Tax=Pycnococcus provasolii TaxID=41880 RepID=A0A830HPK0_9CHLO|nr:hypothetical protein PPROV_000569100 [Pycnococcus provasolii]
MLLRYYPKYKWWAPWTWKYSSNKYNDNKYDSGYDSGYNKYGSGYSKYDSGYSKYDSGYSKYDSGYSKYDSKYGVGPYYGKQYEQDEHYPCDTFYPKPKWYSPFTWKYRKYAKFDYYSGPCEVKKEEHCLPFWGKDLPHDASEATWYTVTHASGGGGCHGGAKNGCDTPPGRRRQLLDRPLYETQYFYAKSEAHGLTFTLTNYYYNNEKLVCAIDDISRKSAICTMAGHFGGSYSTPEKCILTFKTHQKGGKCIPHHMALDCGKPPYVETSKFSKIDYRDIPHKDIIQQDLEECNTCDGSRRLVGTKYTSCDPEPFGSGEPITLTNIANDIRDVLNGDPADVTITSFPCITTSSQEVDFNFGSGELPNLAEVRFANWVTGPDGLFKFEDPFSEGSLTSIYAPLLEGNPNLEVAIDSNHNYSTSLLINLVLTVLVPLVAGKVVREILHCVGGDGSFFDMQTHKRWLVHVSSLSLIIIVWMNVSVGEAQLKAQNGKSISTLVALGILFHLTLLALNAPVVLATMRNQHTASQRWWLPSKEGKAALILSSQKTLPVSLTVLSMLPSEVFETTSIINDSKEQRGLAAVACVVAQICELFMDGAIASWWAGLDVEEEEQ